MFNQLFKKQRLSTYVIIASYQQHRNYAFYHYMNSGIIENISATFIDKNCIIMTNSSSSIGFSPSYSFKER